MPTTGNKGTLFFAYDTGKIYEGRGYGNGNGLTEYSSVLSGYQDLDDLRQTGNKVEGKIYITDESELYIYNGDDYILAGGNGSGSKVSTYEENWSISKNDNLEEVVNMKNIFASNNMRSIISSEFIIFNPLDELGEDNNLEVYIEDNGIPLMSINIEPQETQKYYLGVSTNIKIFIKGTFNLQLYVNYQ